MSEQTPEHQPEQTPPPAGTPAPGAPLTDSDARLWAMLAHLGGMAISFLAPLVVWLIYRERSELVDDQGKEALNFQLTVLIALVAAGVVAGITLGLLSFLPGVVWVANVIFCIIGGVAANRGEHYRYPLTLRLVK